MWRGPVGSRGTANSARLGGPQLPPSSGLLLWTGSGPAEPSSHLPRMSPVSLAAVRTPSPIALTQLLACEGQEGGVLIQVLVEVDAQQAQLLLDLLDLLQRAVRGTLASIGPPGRSHKAMGGGGTSLARPPGHPSYNHQAKDRRRYHASPTPQASELSACRLSSGQADGAISVC